MEELERKLKDIIADRDKLREFIGSLSQDEKDQIVDIFLDKAKEELAAQGYTGVELATRARQKVFGLMFPGEELL